ncbi:glutamate synthase (NADPH/NADH) small chain [Candidatus Termititenax persephonae]|uniref:Glutamate synthase (NADPH/NADH) small chain n=1 Tax=Candidatus Termititenax persephonae TaxID=2218525 RepID=A0A388TF56_9BACT|nr:glutamate synthase (NADPH/NADH) small chain [Candidatus Termititenax persephonae]
MLVVGAGPAGLSAAVEAARLGLRVAVYDENARPGGQLFKQIHKFFGSREHKAKIRGNKIGEELLQEAAAAGVEVMLNAAVIGVFAEKEVAVRVNEQILCRQADALIIATGASENMVNFPGWTLPGVLGAGAAQTMMNLHGVKPGERILLLGSGNVGLVVSYQLLQAGCAVVAVVDALPRIGGYGVHAAKIARCGVPFYTSHTIVRAEGVNQVTGAVIGELDKDRKIIPGSEKHLAVDTICLAVGLSPLSLLCALAGCAMEDNPAKSGYVPLVNRYGETSVAGIFAAGDVSGIEEASAAMIEGRIAGLAAAQRLGFLTQEDLDARVAVQERALASLRQGMFAPGSRGQTFTATTEGCPLSQNLLRQGYLTDTELSAYPGVVWAEGLHPIIECTQNIPCNPCRDACPKQCITVGATAGQITALPIFDAQKGCTGCGLCVAACSGQAIFLVDEEAGEITLPYEFLPLPQKGEQGLALGRSGQEICAAEVVDVKTAKVFDQTNLLTIRVPVQYARQARFFRRAP